MTFWVYILRCNDGSYYTGHPTTLPIELASTSQVGEMVILPAHLPVELVWSQELTTREEALAAEMQIKGVEPQEKRSHDARRLVCRFMLGEKGFWQMKESRRYPELFRSP